MKAFSPVTTMEGFNIVVTNIEDSAVFEFSQELTDPISYPEYRKAFSVTSRNPFHISRRTGRDLRRQFDKFVVQKMLVNGEGWRISASQFKPVSDTFAIIPSHRSQMTKIDEGLFEAPKEWLPNQTGIYGNRSEIKIASRISMTHKDQTEGVVEFGGTHKADVSLGNLQRFGQIRV